MVHVLRYDGENRNAYFDLLNQFAEYVGFYPLVEHSPTFVQERFIHSAFDRHRLLCGYFPLDDSLWRHVYSIQDDAGNLLGMAQLTRELGDCDGTYPAHVAFAFVYPPVPDAVADNIVQALAQTVQTIQGRDHAITPARFNPKDYSDMPPESPWRV